MTRLLTARGEVTLGFGIAAMAAMFALLLQFVVLPAAARMPIDPEPIAAHPALP